MLLIRLINIFIRRSKMKKHMSFFRLALVFLLAMSTLVGQTSGHEDVPNKFAVGEFSVLLNGKVFIEHTHGDGIRINRVERSEDGESINVIVDEDGIPIESRTSDSNFVENLVDGLNGTRTSRLTLSDSTRPSTIYLGTHCYKKTEHSGNDYNILVGIGNHGGGFWGGNYNSSLRPDIVYNSISIMDENFNYICYLYTKDGYKMYEQRALNPDTDFGKYPTLRKDYTIPNYWDISENVSKGYLLLHPDSDKFTAGGFEGSIPVYEPITKDGIIYIGASWLNEAVYGENGYINDNPGGPIKKIYYKFDKTSDKNVNLIKIEMREGDKFMTVNGEKVELPTPIFNYSMVPLFQLCDALKLKYHYRPFDNSILIQRFEDY